MILRSIGQQSTRVLNALEQQFGDEYYYCWNSYRNDPWANQAYAKSIADGKDIMCAETPLIGRKQFNEYADDMYYRIGLNIVSSWFEKNFFIPDNIDDMRIEDILTRTNTEIKPWRTDGEHIIYPMQVPRDSSLMGLDIFAAAQYDLVFLRQITDRPIYITMHPDLQKEWGKAELSKSMDNFEDFKRAVHFTKSMVVENSTESLFDNAWCTVCHTSGTGFDSIAAGIPVIALSNKNFITELAGQNYYDVLDPPMYNRGPTLAKLAYCQWTAQEVEDGTFKKHVDNIRS
jgi:hypothetical protein